MPPAEPHPKPPSREERFGQAIAILAGSTPPDGHSAGLLTLRQISLVPVYIPLYCVH